MNYIATFFLLASSVQFISKNAIDTAHINDIGCNLPPRMPKFPIFLTTSIIGYSPFLNYDQPFPGSSPNVPKMAIMVTLGMNVSICYMGINVSIHNLI